jgi:hypothetical protein
MMSRVSRPTAVAAVAVVAWIVAVNRMMSV